MSNSRVKSVVNYFREEGLLKTALVLNKLFLLKTGFAENINFAGKRKLYFRPGTSDLPAFRQIFLDKEYAFEPGSIPKVIFDLGANVGFASVYFSQRFPEAKIIAVEPEPSNYSQLIKNTVGYSNIHPLCAAVWSSVCELELAMNSDYGDWGASIFITGKSFRVKSTTISELMDHYHVSYIDILKVDIEGSEKEIFSSCGGWINRVRVFVIELHENLVPGCTEAFITAIAHLKNYSTERRGENLIIKNLDLVNSDDQLLDHHL